MMAKQGEKEIPKQGKGVKRIFHPLCLTSDYQLLINFRTHENFCFYI
jgi:hypothetical protein